MRQYVEGRSVLCRLIGEWTHGREFGVCYWTAAISEQRASRLAPRDCPRFSRGWYAELEQPTARSLPLPSYCDRR
jgi:hypothetical protein